MSKTYASVSEMVRDLSPDNLEAIRNIEDHEKVVEAGLLWLKGYYDGDDPPIASGLAIQAFIAGADFQRELTNKLMDEPPVIMRDMSQPFDERRPASKEELDAEYVRHPSEKLREFIDQIGQGDELLHVSKGTGFQALSGHAWAGYVCKKPDGSQTKWCQSFIMS